MRFFQKGVNALLIWPIRAEKAIDKLFGKHLLTERDKENINIKELKSGSRINGRNSPRDVPGSMRRI
jgi:hypothetical protein